MITLCHAAKGGSGTTVVACSRAIDVAGPSLLVDLGGDAPGMLGLPEPDRPGVLDWLESRAPIAHLDDLLIDVTPSCVLLPRRTGPTGIDPTMNVATAFDRVERWDELFDWLVEWSQHSGGSVVIDAGISHVPTTFAEQCTNRWLVTRACYLALRRAGRLTVRPTGIVLVEEPGRGLTVRDVEYSVGAPVVATIAWDPRVARAVDSGLLLNGRLPRVVHRALARVAA